MFVFAGMLTLDVAHLVPNLPDPNAKVVGLDQFVAAGGPATNAAVTCAFLNSRFANSYPKAGRELFAGLGDFISLPEACPSADVRLYSLCGLGSLADLARADLTAHGVEFYDCSPGVEGVLPVSLIMVDQPTGNRAISGISREASEIKIPDLAGLKDASVVLTDGHYPTVSKAVLAACPQAVKVLDGGSWKAWLPEVLPLIDVVVVSADFYPPGCESFTQICDFLAGFGVSKVVQTRGGNPILYRWEESTQIWQGQVEIQANPAPVCTLGAGDIFHGAFTWWMGHAGLPATENQLVESLEFSAKVAQASLNRFGTRTWMENF